MPDLEHKRSHRVGQLIQEELARLFVEGLKDPRIGFVTVTEVRLTHDLRHGQVFVSLFGADDVRQASLEGLKAASGYLRREIGHRLKLRYSPELHFSHDDSLDRAQRLEVLFNAANKGELETPAPVTPEQLPPVETDRIPEPPTHLPRSKPQRPASRRSGRLTRMHGSKRGSSK